MSVAFDLDAYRVERTRKLERDNEHLRAERVRLEQLLADALVVATAGSQTKPLALLGVLAERRGTDLATPAWVEHRARMQTEASIERVVQVLVETAV